MFLKPRVETRKEQTSPHVLIVSYGYKFGALSGNPDINIDLRKIISSELIDWRERGTDPRIMNLVREYTFILHPLSVLIKESFKSSGEFGLYVGIGCTNGRHRSVAVAELMKEYLDDVPVSIVHRDLIGKVLLGPR